MKNALLLIVFAANALAAADPLLLWYDKPAANWNEALPLGNARLGVMVFGGIEDERLQINENTLWAGGPHDYTNPEAGKYLAEIRDLIFRRDVHQAEQLAARVMGIPKMQQPYQPFCDLRLHFPGHGTVEGYRASWIWIRRLQASLIAWEKQRFGGKSSSLIQPRLWWRGLPRISRAASASMRFSKVHSPACK